MNHVAADAPFTAGDYDRRIKALDRMKRNATLTLAKIDRHQKLAGAVRMPVDDPLRYLGTSTNGRPYDLSWRASRYLEELEKRIDVSRMTRSRRGEGRS